jgi:hypothetical protein
LIEVLTQHFFLLYVSGASIPNTRIVLSLLLFSIFMLSTHGIRKTIDASSSNKVGNNSRVKTKTIDGRGAVLFGMKVFWRLLSISFAMFTFNAMVKSMWLRKLQRPLVDIGENHRRYSDRCQPFQKDEVEWIRFSLFLFLDRIDWSIFSPAARRFSAEGRFILTILHARAKLQRRLVHPVQIIFLKTKIHSSFSSLLAFYTSQRSINCCTRFVY